MTKEQREEFANMLIDCEQEYGLIQVGEGEAGNLLEFESRLLNYFESEVEKAKKEGFTNSERCAIEDAFHEVIRKGGSFDEIGESARRKNFKLIN